MNADGTCEFDRRTEDVVPAVADPLGMTDVVFATLGFHFVIGPGSSLCADPQRGKLTVAGGDDAQPAQELSASSCR